MELWWLLGGLMPSFRTIAYLKKNNAEAFRKVFRQFVLMLKDMGLIEGETIGIDSFKIFAQNSLRNNYTQKKIDRHLEYIDNRIEEFEVALDKTDKEEEKELLKSKIKLQQDRRKKYETLDTELKNSNDTQISLTDKDSIMYQELNMRFKQPLIVNTNYWFTLILEHQLIKENYQQRH